MDEKENETPERVETPSEPAQEARPSESQQADSRGPAGEEEASDSGTAASSSEESGDSGTAASSPEESGESETAAPPREETGTTETETPPSEESSVDSDKFQDLIDAIGDLNQTITDAAAGEPEQLPAEEAGSSETGGSSGEVAAIVESSSVDLAPVVTLLKRTNELLEQQSEVQMTQHHDLLQLQANVDFVFLAVCMLAGVVIGCAVSRVFHDLWRA